MESDLEEKAQGIMRYGESDLIGSPCFSAPWQCERGKRKGKHVFADHRRPEMGQASGLGVTSRLGGSILTAMMSAANSIAEQDGGLSAILVRSAFLSLARSAYCVD